VIRNLLSNAIKFTPREGQVNVYAYRKRIRGKSKLVIQVKDTGVGMTAETMDQLMTRNIHFTTYGTDNEKGSGLGLQLCKEFISLNDGEFWIESKAGKGSSFFISLPLSGK